jgi:hypothetical protein
MKLLTLLGQKTLSQLSPFIHCTPLWKTCPYVQWAGGRSNTKEGPE